MDMSHFFLHPAQLNPPDKQIRVSVPYLNLVRRRCGLLPDYFGHMSKKEKGSPYSITDRRVPELIPVLGSQPAGDVSHKPGGRLPLLSPST